MKIFCGVLLLCYYANGTIKAKWIGSWYTGLLLHRYRSPMYRDIRFPNRLPGRWTQARRQRQRHARMALAALGHVARGNLLVRLDRVIKKLSEVATWCSIRNMRMTAGFVLSLNALVKHSTGVARRRYTSFALRSGKILNNMAELVLTGRNVATLVQDFVDSLQSCKFA